MKYFRLDYDVEKYCSILLTNKNDYNSLPIFDNGAKKNVWSDFKAKLDNTKKYRIGDFAYITAGVISLKSNIVNKVIEILPSNIEVLNFKMVGDKKTRGVRPCKLTFSIL